MIEHLQRKFGKRLAELIEASPTLKKDLRALRSRHVRIRRLNGECRAYSRSHPGQEEGALICISVHCNPIQQAHYLAHEAFHILSGKTPIHFDPATISKKRYINMAMSEEASCIAHELKVTQELHEAGYFVGSANLSWLVDYLVGGFMALKKRLGHTHLSASSLTYPEYFAKVYESRVEEIARDEKRAEEVSKERQKQRARAG